MRASLIRVAASVVAAGCLVAPATEATNAAFQSFFFDVCVNPSATLAARCAETNAGLGDLSGDSESSLNPSQGLSHNDAALAVAQTRSRESRERGERMREDDASSSDGAVSVGPFSLMLHGRGVWFEQERVVDVEAERGYDGEQFAAEIGLDYRLSDDAVIGAIVGFEQVDVDFDTENPGNNFTPAAEAGDNEVDTISITLFGAVNLTENIYIDGTLGYGTSDYEFRRNVVFQESNRVVPQTDVRTEGDADGDSIWAGVNLGYQTQNDAWSWGSYVGLTYASSDIDGYTESDRSSSGLNMTVGDLDRDSVLAHLGVVAAYTISTANGVWVPSIRVEYDHEFDRDAQDLNTVFVLDANQTSFASRGDEPDEDYFNIALGIVGVLPNGWAPFLEADIVVGYDDFDRSRVQLGVRKEF